MYVSGLQISFGSTDQVMAVNKQTLSEKNGDNIEIECGPRPRCRREGGCTTWCKCTGQGTIGKCVRNLCECDN